MSFLKSVFIAFLFTLLMGGTVFGKVYEFRNGRMQVQSGTESSGDTNITIDDLMETLLNYQTRINELDEKLRKRDQQILQLQDDVKAATRDLTLLKNHYFRQY